MRLTLYYCFHAFINQIKKLMKTWVLIFILVCMGLGVAVGVIAASVSEKVEEDTPVSEETEEEETAGEDAAEEEETLAKRIGVEKNQLVEAACGLAATLILLLMAINADKRGSAIFLRADAILLFASPMKPQSVLMFRLVVQMLTIVIIACLYLPNVVLNMGMSVGMGCLVVADFILLFCLGLMIEMLLYCLSSTHPKLKDSIKRIVYGTLILVAAGFLLYYKQSGESAVKAAVRFFSAPIGRWIPLWGWVKGFLGAAMEGKAAMAVLFGALTMLSLGGMIYLVWHVKADFYESALAKSEETAALLEKQQESKGLTVAVKKKDREDDLKRDGLTHGWGASVLFYKNMYNRFRCAHLHVLTKGMELCMAAAIVTQLLARFAFKTDSFLPLVAVLGVLTFYKTLNSPLEQDTAMDYFLMIPESPWKKLAWSLLADVCCCVMDLLPAVILGILIGGLMPLRTLMWLPFLVSIDVYGAVIGTFFAHAIPTFVDAKVKQLFQIIFVEFGLVPIALIMVFGVVSGRILMAALSATVVNLTLAGVVFGVTPLIIDPATRK